MEETETTPESLENTENQESPRENEDAEKPESQESPEESDAKESIQQEESLLQYETSESGTGSGIEGSLPEKIGIEIETETETETVTETETETESETETETESETETETETEMESETDTETESETEIDIGQIINDAVSNISASYPEATDYSGEITQLHAETIEHIEKLEAYARAGFTSSVALLATAMFTAGVTIGHSFWSRLRGG